MKDLLDRLQSMVPDADRPAVVELCRRLRANQLRILVAGEAKRGKSTLINALLDRELLPTGVLPLTAITTTLAYGDTDAVEVSYADGRRATTGLDTIADWVTEERNPGNVRGVAEVFVRCADRLLERGVELVDTPGVGSIYEHNTAHASDALARMDVCIFVTSADPPLSASERALLETIRASAIRIFAVLTKIDQLDPHEIDQVREFVGHGMSTTLDSPITPVPVSARRFLRANTEQERIDSAIPALLRLLDDYLLSHRSADLRASVAAHAGRLANQEIDEARLTIRTAEMSGESLAERQRLFTDRLTVVRRLSDESRALLDAGIQRLTAETNDLAATAALAATATLQAGFAEWAAGRDGPPAELDRTGRAWLTEQTAAAVVGWRTEREMQVNAVLDDLVRDLQTRLRDQIAAVHAAAAEAFEIGGTAQAITADLSTETRFRSTGAEMAGFSELLAAGIRTHLPASFARRKVLDRLQTDVPELMDRAFGRARADFHQRLIETRRRLHRDLARQHDRAVDRINAAVSAGRELARRDAEQRGTRLAEIHERISELERLVKQFAESASCGAVHIRAGEDRVR